MRTRRPGLRTLVLRYAQVLADLRACTDELKPMPRVGELNAEILAGHGASALSEVQERAWNRFCGTKKQRAEARKKALTCGQK